MTYLPAINSLLMSLKQKIFLSISSGNCRIKNHSGGVMFKGHPKGLMVLFFTEMWERFGFYTMLAVFTLYMDETLGWSDSYKGQVYGLYLGFVYFTPIAGGWIADK